MKSTVDLSHLVINRVNVANLNELVQISKQTYLETFFEAFNDDEAYHAYTAEAFCCERLEMELADANTAFYFASADGIAVGYIKINYLSSQTVFYGNFAAELERIYVLSGYHHQRIGKALLAYAINLARVKGFFRLWLTVWEHNHKAIKFYERNGFIQSDTRNYQVAGDPQTDFLMDIHLNTSKQSAAGFH